MNHFVHKTRAGRVVFGEGTIRGLPEEVDRLGASRVHLLASRRVAEAASDLLGESMVVHTDKLVQHVPLDEVERGAVLNNTFEVDAYVAIGGGSAIGLAKAFALRHPAPIIAVPTTFSGSEMSAVWGTTSDGVKTTGTDDSIAPATVIYDPELVAGLPRSMAVTSAVNAAAHAVEALYAVDGSPVVSLIAEEAIRLIAQSLDDWATPAVEGNDVSTDRLSASGRRHALHGAWLSGICLGSVSMALHHKICHTLGGTFGLPHSSVHTVMLPFVLAFNGEAAPAATAAVARALAVDDAAAGLQSLIARAGGPTDLRALGFSRSDIDTAVELAASKPYPNPRPIEAAGLRSLLTAAYEGSTDRLGA